MRKKRETEIFPSAFDDAQAAELCVESPQTLSPSYRLAYRDTDFLLRDELRPARLQLELLKPELNFSNMLRRQRKLRRLL